jgi:hypothetical protein
MQRALTWQHIAEEKGSLSVTDDLKVRGRFEWDGETDGELPLLVIDGKAVTWDEFCAGYTIVSISNGIPPDEKSEGIYSAVGNHINFLRLGNKLLLPTYGIPEDEKAIESLRRTLSYDDVIPVKIPGIRKLASKGGVLNCITWSYFLEL